jgi:hypothetical protein
MRVDTINSSHELNSRCTHQWISARDRRQAPSRIDSQDNTADSLENTIDRQECIERSSLWFRCSLARRTRHNT